MTYADEVKRKIAKTAGAGHVQCQHRELEATSTRGLYQCRACFVVWSKREIERVADELQPAPVLRESDDAFTRAAARAHLEAVGVKLYQGVTRVVRNQWVAGHKAGFAAGWEAALLASKRVVVPVDLDALSAELRAPFDPRKAVRS